MSIFLKDLTQAELATALKPYYDEINTLFQEDNSLRRDESAVPSFDDLVASSYNHLRGEKFDDTIWGEREFQQFQLRASTPVFDCVGAIGVVVVDAFGIAGTIMGIGAATGQLIGQALSELMPAESLTGIRLTIQSFEATDNTAKKALIIFKILGDISRVVGVKGLFRAIKNSLDVRQAIIMTVTIFAQLAVWAATDGLLLVAQIVLLADLLFDAVTDIQKAIETCGLLRPDVGRVKLGESSDTSPAICQFNSGLRVVWAGKSDKKINVLFSEDGKTFPDKVKVTLPQTTDLAPAVATFATRLFVAWAAKDANNSLSIFSSADGRSFSGVTKLPFITSVAPGLAHFNGRLYIAWANKEESDAIKIASSADGVNFETATVVGETTTQSVSLTAAFGQLYLGFAGTDKQVNHIHTADGTHFGGKVTYGTKTNSGVQVSYGGNMLWMTWTGDDDKINYMPLIGKSKRQELGVEKADGTPCLAYPFIAWTGTDSSHLLNVAPI